jgi:hypothetical protein
VNKSVRLKKEEGRRKKEEVYKMGIQNPNSKWAISFLSGY